MHDSFIRAILSDKSVAADYFLAYLPFTVSRHLDFTTLTHLPDSYLSDELQKTMSDIVYTCRKRSGKEAVKVSLLIEHKSYPDKYTPIQIGSYLFSALQKQVANKEPLSIVIPVLLYHGRGRWRYRTLAQLFKNIEPEWKPYLPDFDYVYNNLNEVPDEQVVQLNNQFLAASLLTLKHTFEKEWLAQNALRMLVLVEAAPDYLQKQLVVYLFGRSELLAEEVNKLFDSLSLSYKHKVMSTLNYLKEEGRKIGIVEGREKGREEGREKGIVEGAERKSAEFVKNLLLAEKFSVAEIASLANVTEAFVLQVKAMME